MKDHVCSFWYIRVATVITAFYKLSGEVVVCKMFFLRYKKVSGFNFRPEVPNPLCDEHGGCAVAVGTAAVEYWSHYSTKFTKKERLPLSDKLDIYLNPTKHRHGLEQIQLLV